MDGAAYIQTCYHELRKFKLGPITKLDKDDNEDAEHLQLPLTFAINGNANYVETDANILKVWGNLWSESEDSSEFCSEQLTSFAKLIVTWT